MTRRWSFAACCAAWCWTAPAPAAEAPGLEFFEKSVRPVAAPAPPSIRNPRSAIRNPLDAFVLARLEAAGLSPAPPADKRTLLRRVTFDLTGLPPTPAEIDAFLADDTAAAFAKVV